MPSSVNEAVPSKNVSFGNALETNSDDSYKDNSNIVLLDWYLF